MLYIYDIPLPSDFAKATRIREKIAADVTGKARWSRIDGGVRLTCDQPVKGLTNAKQKQAARNQ